MSINAEHITKLYGDQKALDDVSMEVNQGQVVGFLGPNGAGKSTLMRILTCFIPPSSGNASVFGHDVMNDPIGVRRNVGYLPENNPLYTHMYVREYLDFIGGLYKLPDRSERMEEMIRTVGLELEQHKKIEQLSKGYRQRVGLAQVLMHDPPVLILDEPTTGLDPNQLEEIRGLIKKIGREKTVLLSTHIMQEVEAVCDRALIIHQGRIVADDPVEQLHEHTAGAVAFRVEFETAVSESALKAIEGVETVELLEGNTWKIASTGGQDIRQAIFRFAVDHELSVLTLQREEERLEEVFRRLTQ